MFIHDKAIHTGGYIALLCQQGGPEQLAMKMQLERLFIEGEQERIRQENIEKQQAEQVAAGEFDHPYRVANIRISFRHL